MMSWDQLQDPDNRENPNAGNGGDLGKHSVYLAVLRYLLAQGPWSEGIRIRECHAGRGIYEIPAADARRSLLECLFAPMNADVGLPLHDLQRASQSALAVWPTRPERLRWYSGSALLNAWCLGSAAAGHHLLELYELAPDTRCVLSTLFAMPALQLPGLDVRILPETEDKSYFDGELHIENSVGAWNARDLIVLDPFAMWRQDQDQPRRDRYRGVIDRVVSKGQDAPSLILFWTWGRAFPVAEGDLDGTSSPVRNGYQELRECLHCAGRRFIRVTWRWGLQFAMWVLVPDPHLTGVCAALRRECDATRNHLVRGGCSGRLANPNIDVVID